MSEDTSRPLLRANYHSHTWRCQHAWGTEREYVEKAIEAGYKVWGFSDHTPQLFSQGYRSTIRMTPDQLEDYVDTVLDLRREYREQIDVRLGLEVEYFPGAFDGLLRLTEQYPIEYFLLGQHFLDTEEGGFYTGRPTADPEVLRHYCRQTSEALDTGRFACFAHPDLVNFTGDPALYREEMLGLIRHAKSLEIPLEINLLGLATGRNYPNPVFWDLVREEDAPVILGVDAHASEQIADRETPARALKLAEGLRRREEIDLGRLG